MTTDKTQALLERVPYTINLLRVCGEDASADAVEALTQELAEVRRERDAAIEALREMHEALEWALSVAAGVVKMGDPHYNRACETFCNVEEMLPAALPATEQGEGDGPRNPHS